MPKALKSILFILMLSLLLIPMLQHRQVQAAPVLGITPTVTMTPTSTPTWTPTVTGTPPTVTPTSTQPTATPTSTPPLPPAVAVPSEGPDLAIVKRSDPQEARPGEQVSFTLEVTNPGKEAAVDVVVVDDVPPQLEILEVTTTQGTATFEGQRVTVQVGTVGPEFLVKIVIRTRVRIDVSASIDVENIATARAANTNERTARAVVHIVVDRLPVTGMAGNPALKLEIVLVGLLVLSLAGFWESMHASREHTR